MTDRVEKDHFLGWQLALGLLIFVGMTLLLAVLAEHVVTGRPLIHLDQQLSAWIGRNRSPQLTTFFTVVTAFGSTAAAIAIAVGVGIYLLRRRQRYWFAAITLTIVGGVTLNRFLKIAFQRARPQLDDPIRSFAGFSFPSGHTVTATVVYGAVALLFFTRVKTLRSRVVVIASASLLILLVGFSRIYLGAHYLTDVLAAIAEGVAWISLSFTIVSTWRQVATRRNNKNAG
jgi:membrane-associated phospholipid phosphatase